MVGLPASGKSYHAQKLAAQENAVIHSSDSLRKELFGDENTQEESNEVHKELHRRIKEDLKIGKNVIYDATNISHKKRMSLLKQITNLNVFKQCVLMATPYEQCVEQNKQRERKIPECVIRRMYKNIFIPQMYEGWDSIHIIWNAQRLDGFNTKEYLMHLKTIPHDNPHHTLTIGDHCLKCGVIVSNKTGDNTLAISAYLHDIGKEFTKQFENGKREKTDIAHFYNHQNVSAYLSLFYLKKYANCNPEEEITDDDLLKVANYIQWHMMPFFMDSEKSKQKFINLVGQDFYDRLLILHEADKMAH